LERPTPAARRLSTISDIPSIVLIDGSALFLAIRAFGEGRSLDYRAFIDTLCSTIPGLVPPNGNHRDDSSHWVMWTSWSPENGGQNKFLEFAEMELLWTVRRISPSDSFLIDPSSMLGPTPDAKVVSRLTRFDSPISFAMGRVAEDRRLILVSDSYSLAEPMARAHQIRMKRFKASNAVAFFGRALDPRWPRALREQSSHIDLVDLDDHEAALFGGHGKEAKRRYHDDLPY
jgi:hypothetical protein